MKQQYEQITFIDGSQTGDPSSRQGNTLGSIGKYNKRLIMKIILVLSIVVLFAGTYFLWKFVFHVQPEVFFIKNYTDQFIKNFGIKVTEFPNKVIYGRSIMDYGIGKNIQIGSDYDLLNITSSQKFKYLKNNLDQLFPHQVYTFKHDPSLEGAIPTINYSYFKDEDEIKRYYYNIMQWNGKNKFDQMRQIYLAAKLVTNFGDQRVREMEYYHFDKKYNISKIKQQLPICLFSTGYKVFTKDRYKQYFQSINRQNYSNYVAVVVDDNSPDGSAQHFYNYLNDTTFRLKNRIKIVRNRERVGALANIYYWVNKLCPSDSIVAIVDNDDSIIGAQVFNTLNAIYQDPGIWYAYSEYLEFGGFFNSPIRGVSSRYYTFDVADYRNYMSQWYISHLRTFRQKLMKAAPLQAFVEYHYQQKLGYLLPRFYGSAADTFQVLNLIQLCGNSRIKYIDDFFYYYEGPPSKPCYWDHEYFDSRKARIKKSLKVMESIDDEGQFDQKDIKTAQNFEILLKAYSGYRSKCFKQ